MIVKLEKITNILVGTLYISCLGLCGLMLLDRVTAKQEKVRKVKSELKIRGIPSPFTMWDAYYEHTLTFEDGSTRTEITRDYDWADIKKLTGCKTVHPQIGDEYLFGGIIGKNYGKVKPR